ncbi:cation-efflux pump [Candidatus Bathyarchaeota archaeon]|nr:cation-efflux pump [Candidatus Bathyarchaeota archaeon]
MRSASESNYKLKTLKYSTIAITTVVFVELTLGLAVGSLAIVSDGLHATLDAVTTLTLFIVTRASLKPPDEEHMYGHEKFEPIGGLVGGIALVGTALLVIYEAVLRIISNQSIEFRLEYVGFIAIGYTFCIDFFRVGTLMRARKSESSTMKAGFYHALADLSSTIIAFLGFGLATLGLRFGDALASIVLGVLLSYFSVRLIWESGMELSDTTSKEVADKVRKEIVNTKGVYRCEDLKIRKAGDKTFVRATVQVPDYLDVEEAHDLASKVETNIKGILSNSDVTIHTEPFATGMPTEKLIERLTMETGGVKGVHEIDTAYTEGKLYITLHIYVDSKLSVEKADEIAEKIEDRIEERIREVENVTVHIEPYSAKKQKGPMVNEDEISKAIHEATQSSRVFRIKRIVTYVADEKRHINIDCCFTKQISVEDAHKIASEVEEKVKSHFAETIVTVHTESEQQL